MTQRTKLELKLNQPVEIELLYDEPVVGENSYGSYFLYAVRSEMSEYSFFAPEPVHDELKNLRKGDTAIVIKSAMQKGNKVVTNDQVTTPEKVKASVKANGVTRQNDYEDRGYKPEPQSSKEPLKSADNFFEIMLKCYSDALEIQNELGNMIDVSRIAITLFIARSKSNGNTIRSEVL
jgi:hypothetical protein